jgi:putative heme-binding domain-containing protein
VKEAGPLRAPALRGLASFDDARIPETILAAYGTLTSEEKGNALGTLLTRPAWGHAVIGAIDAKTVARADLSAPLARQLADFKDAKISDWLAKNWGAVRPTSAEKQQQIAGYKKLLTIDALNKADPSHGRAIYGQVCAACHTLFGAGGKVGPELPGAYEDVDYLLQNIIDPNAVIGKDYQQTIVRTKDGQQLMGIVAGEDATTLTLKTLAGMLTVQRADIAGVEVMEVSLMPEGLLTALNETQVRDLFAYLRRHGQVPMLLSPNNANDFFNGTDLARWIPSKADAWRVENGEIVGKGNAQRAEFLTSDTVAGDFKLTALVQLSGADAAGEIVLRGQFTDGGLEGVGLGLGKAPAGLLLHRPPKAPVPVAEAKPLAAEKWTKLEITATGSKVRVTADGAPAAQCDVPEGSSRTVPAFYVSGPGSELRIKDLRIEMLAK